MSYLDPTQTPTCACGCGQVTTRLIYDYPRHGLKAGDYRRYVNGHNGRGKRRPREVVEKQSAAIRGDNHWTKRKSFSMETRMKMSESQKKRHAHRLERYDGGFPNQRGRWAPELKVWRKSVFERDHFTCQDCGKVGGYLNAHHVKSWAKYPDLRFELTNGITLCETPCHKKAHAKKKVKAHVLLR